MLELDISIVSLTVLKHLNRWWIYWF